MDNKDYCSAIEAEITAWKAKLYDAMRKMEKLPGVARDKVLYNIQDLNMLLDDMSERVNELRTQCPSDWSPLKKEIESGTLDMRGKYEETLDFIGKAAPVSVPG
jgi:hypothetical protein